MISIFIGNSGSCKTVHALTRVVHALEQGRSVYTNNESFFRFDTDSFSFLEFFPKLHFVQTQDFWRHVQPGSLIVIDEYGLHALEQMSDRFHEFFECWFRDHYFSGTEFILISQSLFSPARMFHHLPDDCSVHKIVNPTQVYQFFRLDFPLLRLRFYGFKVGIVDNSYLFSGLNHSQPSIDVSWKHRRFFSLPRTLWRIESFFEEARFQSRLDKFFLSDRPGYGYDDSEEV